MPKKASPKKGHILGPTPRFRKRNNSSDSGDSGDSKSEEFSIPNDEGGSGYLIKHDLMVAFENPSTPTPEGHPTLKTHRIWRDLKLIFQGFLSAHPTQRGCGDTSLQKIQFSRKFCHFGSFLVITVVLRPLVLGPQVEFFGGETTGINRSHQDLSFAPIFSG